MGSPTTTSSGSARRCRSSTSSASTSRCARSGATGSGCARSTPRRRPSFYVSEETGLLQVLRLRQVAATSSRSSGSIEHLDFVGAVEYAGRPRPACSSRYTTTAARAGASASASGSSRPWTTAVDWYHQRLLDGARRPARPATTCASRGSTATSPASSSSAGRPTTGTRWPRQLGLAAERAAGDRARRSSTSRNRLQDSFRARVLFPIFDDTGEAVAFGGRILPGVDDPAKYKNSPETPIYAKSKTLYGLNWAKADIVGGRPGHRVRGLHRRHRVPPRRRDRGPWPPAARRSPRSTCAC